MPGPVGRKVVVVRIAENLRISSPGGGTTWTYIPVDVPAGVAEWGPNLEQITAHCKTQARTTSNDWKVVFYWSHDGASWSGPLDLFAAISADGDTIQTPYATASNFGLKMRYAIAVRANAGTSSESATVSCALAFTFLT